MKTSKIIRTYQIAFIILASYGIFYFSYKYYIPSLAGADFYNYYAMYLKPLDFEQAPAPFIYRQFSAFITNIIYEMGIYYPNGIAFSETEYKQEVFFSALFSNYIALLLTAIIVSSMVNIKITSNLLLAPILGGLLCFLSFFTQSTVITGISEGWSWFLVSLAFYGYISRNIFITAPILLLSIFQRESIAILFLVIAFSDWLLMTNKYKRFYLLVAIFSILSFVTHLLIRTVFIPIKDVESHLVLQNMLPNFLSAFHPPRDLMLQSFISQNIYMLFVATILLLLYLQRMHKKPLNILNTGIIQVTLALFSIYLMGAIAGIGNNAGRLLSLATPIIATLTAIHFTRIENLLTISNLKKTDGIKMKNS